MKSILLIVSLLLVLALDCFATTYEVKPGTPLDTIAEVPWASLQPGDTVLIYWKATAVQGKMGDLPARNGGVANNRSRRARAERRASGDRRERCDHADEPELLERESRHDKDRRGECACRHDAEIHYYRKPRNSRSFSRISIHAIQRPDPNLRAKRRTDLCRKGRESDDPKLHHHRRRQRSVHRIFGHRHVAKYSGRRKLHLRQRQLGQRLRAQQLHSGDRHNISIQSVRAAAGWGERNRLEGPVGGPCRSVQLDRGRQPQS